MLQPSAYCATRRSVLRSPEPPMRIGMSPRSGCGLLSALAMDKRLPSKLDSDCVNIRRAMLQRVLEQHEAVAQRRELVAVREVLLLEPRRPDAEEHARPPEITSSVVVILAMSAGLRYVTPPTRRPRLSRDVRAASPARVVLPSSMNSARSPTPGI